METFALWMLRIATPLFALFALMVACAAERAGSHWAALLGVVVFAVQADIACQGWGVRPFT